MNDINIDGLNISAMQRNMKILAEQNQAQGKMLLKLQARIEKLEVANSLTKMSGDTPDILKSIFRPKRDY